MSALIERLNAKLEGELIHAERVYGVPFALPGDRISYRIFGRGKRRRLVVDEVERGPAARQEPFCEHFGVCGGCRGQHLSIDEQFELKVRSYRADMIEHFAVTPIELMPERVQRYRNRMDFVVEGKAVQRSSSEESSSEGCIVGLRPAGDFRRFVDIRSCHIQRGRADEILSRTRRLISAYPGLPFMRREKTGILKYVTIREGRISGAVILTSCEGNADEPVFREFVSELCKMLEGYERENGYRFSLFTGEVGPLSEVSAVPRSQLLYGDPYFEEALGPLSFQVPPDAFFQPNPDGFFRLYQAALEAVRPRWHGGSVIDLYCGSAVLSLVLAETLTGITALHGADFSASGIELGRRNIESYLKSKGAGFTFDLQARDLNRGEMLFPDADLVIVDPPRAGLAPGVIRWLNEHPAPLLLYISCNPSAQVENLLALREVYRPVFAAVTDPFPQTTHLESAVLLERRP